MIAILATTAYVTGWFVFTVYASRFAASSKYFTGFCHGESNGRSIHRTLFRTRCEKEHYENCWRSEGVLTPALVGVVGAVALLWPIAWLPALAYGVALRKPTPQEVERRREQEKKELEERIEQQRVLIAQMEKDAGISRG